MKYQHGTYHPPKTIAHTLQQITNGKYVLPAIQREFVWKPDQICGLFDSVMQGYPFGTFLFWKVDAQNSANYRFYGFVRDFHERDNPHCPTLPVIHNTELTAVLDGQQRLTALNIGLLGSIAYKEPSKRWTNNNAFIRKKLYLDLLSTQDDEEQGAAYKFRFLAPERATLLPDLGDAWFPVSEILKFSGGPDMLKWVTSNGFTGDAINRAYEVLDRLHNVINREVVVTNYEEPSQDIERVLTIFIRMNSGGTQLSYSDLLLSIATAQWTKLDARSEIHSLVDDLNRIGPGLGITKDFVLKAGLMLTDIRSVGFKVENFTSENMGVLESNWSAIRRALSLTVELMASFGLSSYNLRAVSALLPIAYYLYRKAPTDNYLTHSSHADDRRSIQRWLYRSLLKASGVWGSGLDTLLTALRSALQEAGYERFPHEALSVVMSRRGKSLTFEVEEIEELAAMAYGDRRTFLLLSLLYPFVDLRNQFHIDHVFPRGAFSKQRLTKEGLDEGDVHRFVSQMNTLANLQLLEGPFNNEKRAKMPAEWLRMQFSSEQDRSAYEARHDLGALPEQITGFPEFIARRQTKLIARITELLGRATSAD